jgi:hypothetical protein
MLASVMRHPARTAAVLAATLGATFILQPPVARALVLEPWVLPEAIVTGGEPTFRGTIGFGLILEQPRKAQQLGFWDELGDGLLSDHAVSLFDGSGSLLASAVVPRGSAAQLQDGFRWVSIPELWLTAGTYVLAASIDGDPATFDAVITDTSTVATLAGLTLDPSGALRSLPVDAGDPIPTALLPTLVDGGSGYFGPNMAPGPLPLLGGAAAWSWSRRLRCRCRQRLDRG